MFSCGLPTKFDCCPKNNYLSIDIKNPFFNCSSTTSNFYIMASCGSTWKANNKTLIFLVKEPSRNAFYYAFFYGFTRKRMKNDNGGTR